MNDTTITAAIACIQDLFRGNSGGHDAAHSLRVYRNALLIAEGEPGCDTEIVALAPRGTTSASESTARFPRRGARKRRR